MQFHQFSIWVNAAIFIASAAVVWYAGVRLARYADAIAERTGIGRALLGIMLLGGVTSLPELAVATTATLSGEPALTISEVLGSAAINIVIIALADARVGRDALTSILGSPSVLLQGVLGIVIMALTLGASMVGDTLLLGIGAWSWLMLTAYLVGIRLLAHSHAARAWHIAKESLPEKGEREPDAGANPDERPLRRLIQLTVAAALGILAAGFLLAKTASALAEQTGLGTSFFGAVFLGFTTSLPEVSTVFSAVKLRRYEMALSDVFGTNLFNVTIIVLVDALHPGGPVLLEVGRTASFGALLALLLTAIYLVGMLERRDRAFLRMGYDSIAVLLTYIGGVIVLHTLQTSGQ